uniref:Uncharacterized protein n=1 Tax=Oncorhynchus tshawytscha TaxID=74940 RepID=A0AAZ3P7D8_ONCTS
MALIEAWFMDDSDKDQRMPHKLNPNKPVSLEELEKLLDADIYETDPAYSDIIIIHEDKLPNYEDKVYLRHCVLKQSPSRQATDSSRACFIWVERDDSSRACFFWVERDDSSSYMVVRVHSFTVSKNVQLLMYPRKCMSKLINYSCHKLL